MRHGAVLLVCLAAAGCPKKEEATSASPSQPHPPPVQAPAETSPPRGRADSVGEKLQQEVATRSSGNPKAEEVFAALEKAGVHLKDQRQHAASPVGASFCIGAQSEHNLSLSVCEYSDEAAARAGRELSLKSFSAIANRDVFLKSATTLTVLQSPRTAESEAEAKRAVEAFNKL